MSDKNTNFEPKPQTEPQNTNINPNYSNPSKEYYNEGGSAECISIPKKPIPPEE